MSGSLRREERQVLPQGAGVTDMSASLRFAGAAAAQQGREIAGVLDPLAGRVMGLATEEAEKRGEREGWSETLQRGPDGAVVVPDGDALTSGPLTTAAEARRRAVLASRYGSELLMGSERSILALRTQHQADPQAFLRSAEAWRDGTVEGLPPVLRPIVAQGAQRLITQHYANLVADNDRRDRQSARESAEASLRQLGGAAFDAAVQGGDATEARQAALVKLEADRATGVWSPAEYQERHRRLTVLDPALAATQRAALQAGPGGVGALVIAMNGGPGTPGWRQEWAALTPDERRGMASLINALGGNMRAEESYRWTQGSRGASIAMAGIENQIARIQQTAANERRAITAEERTQIGDLLDQGERAGRGFGMSIAGSRRSALAFEEAQGNRAEGVQRSQMAVAEGLRTLAGDEPDTPQARRASELWQRVRDLPLDVQAAVITQETREMAVVQRQTMAEVARFEEYRSAAAGQRAPVSRTPDNERVATALINAHGVRSIMDEGAPQAIIGVAAGGILPQWVATELRGALRSGDARQVERAAQMADLLDSSDNTAVREAYYAAMGARERAGFLGMARMIGTLRAGTAQGQDAQTDARIVALTEFSRQQAGRASDQNPRQYQQDRMTERFGDAAAQRRQIDEGVERVMGSDLPIPDAMREDITAHIVSLIDVIPDPQALVTQAVREIQTGGAWGLSTTTYSHAAAPRPDFFMRVAANTPAGLLMQAVTGSSPATTPQRWARYPTDRITVPDGRSGGESITWQTTLARGAARGANIPGADSLTLGADAFWKPVIRGGRLDGYTLQVRREGGHFWPVTALNERGTENGTQPRIYNIQAEAADRRARRSGTELPRYQQEFDRRFGPRPPTTDAANLAPVMP